jgi:hypothetical protein
MHHPHPTGTSPTGEQPADTAQILVFDRARHPPVEAAPAARHGAQLVHAARVGDELVRLVALSDEHDTDRASFIAALAAFDRWQRELRARPVA